MELKKMKYIVMAISIPVFFIFQTGCVKAEQVQIESTGYYVVGDGPDEKISTARERARVEAMRMAAEKGGVFVEGISEVKNSQLTRDEINVITAQIMQISKEDIQPVVDGKYIKYVCHIVATIDTDSLNINDYIENKKALYENVKLQEEIARLRNENLSLKQKYQNSETNVEKEQIEQQIKNNEKNFKRAVVEIPIAKDRFGTSFVDSSTINYDEAGGMITFKVHEFDKKYDSVSSIEVDVKRNCLRYVDQTISLKLINETTYIKCDNPMHPIYGPFPGTREVIKIYNYLGIEPENMYRNADWNLIYSASDGTKYYIDTANSRYDSVRALGSFPIKRFNENGLYEFLGRMKRTDYNLFYYDYTCGRIGIWENKIEYDDPFLYNDDIISACKEAKKICVSYGRKASIWEQS